MALPKVAVGSFVLFTLDAGRGAGQVRPALVVGEYPSDSDPLKQRPNLLVFLDGPLDDGADPTFHPDVSSPVALVMRREYVAYDAKGAPGTFRLPPDPVIPAWGSALSGKVDTHERRLAALAPEDS